MFLGYCRVSTSEQAADGTTSLQEQHRIIKGMAMARGIGAYDLQIFEDAGVSGSIHMKYRPAGRELLETVKKGDVVVAAKLDRMFRNALDALKIYTDFKERGIDLILFDLGVNPVTEDNSTSKLLFQIMSAFADHERENIRARMLDGKAAKRAKGGHAGGEAPYGWQIVGAKREARLVPVAHEQKVIATLVEMPDKLGFDKRQPLPIGTLTRRLNDLGHRTRTGKPFVFAQVQRILKHNEKQAHAVH